MPDETYTIKEMLVEIRGDYTTRLDSQDKLLSEIKQDGKETKEKVSIQNGRVRLLEDWSTKAQKIIEGNTDTLSMYKTDKTKL